MAINLINRNRIERIYLFAKTDYFVRYYGSKLGILWAFLNPFFRIMVYYFVFSYLIFRKKDPEFILYLFTGVITWQFFSEVTNEGIKLFLKQRFILQNISIPKVDFFIAMLFSKMYGYLVNFGIYFLFALLFFNPTYSWKLFLLIPVILGLSLVSIGISFILATLYIFFRDLIHIWTIILLLGFWTVPIIWDYHLIYDTYPFMIYNPVTAFVIDIREITLHNAIPDMQMMGISILSSILICLIGYIFMHSFSKKAMEFL